MPRTIVVCLGGFTTGLALRWADGGRLPHLSALFADGFGGAIAPLPVPYESSALESAFTGAPPGDHGVLSMWRMREPSVAAIPREIERHQGSPPYLWERPEFAGRKAVVVNVIGSHPPRPMPGLIVTYPFHQTIRCAWPRTVLPALIEAGTPMAHDVSVFFRAGDDRHAFAAAVTRVERQRMEAFRTLLRQPADLFVLNLTIADRLSHFLWDEVAADSSMAPEDTAIGQAYALLDGFLGQVTAELRADDHLLAFTDLSFGPVRRFFSVNAILAGAGFHAEGAPFLPDPDRCLAFESAQGSHGIVLSRKDRFVDGRLDAAAADRVEAEIAQLLREARDEESGNPLFATVVRGRDLYPGPRADDAPDLVAIPFDEECQPLGHPFWANHVSRHCQTGWHRRDAAWSLIGPRAGRAGTGPAMDMTAVAGLMADLLDLDSPDLRRRSVLSQPVPHDQTLPLARP